MVSPTKADLVIVDLEQPPNRPKGQGSHVAQPHPLPETTTPGEQNPGKQTDRGQIEQQFDCG